MSLISRHLSQLSYIIIASGVGFGSFGLVRIGALLIAAGTAGYAISHPGNRAIERYLPLVIALALFFLALALAHKR